MIGKNRLSGANGAELSTSRALWSGFRCSSPCHSSDGAPWAWDPGGGGRQRVHPQTAGIQGAAFGGRMVNNRRFPPPWRADKIPGGSVTPTADNKLLGKAD